MEVAAAALAGVVIVAFSLLTVVMWRSAGAQRRRGYRPGSPTLRWLSSLISGDGNRER